MAKISRIRLMTRFFAVLVLILLASLTYSQGDVPYPIVDTGQNNCYSDSSAITCGTAYNGQDAQYNGNQPAYQDNGDGTVTDLNTGLMWISDPGEKTNYADAMSQLQNYSFAGYDDWRLPSIKELYSLTNFNGTDPSAMDSSSASGLIPFIDTDYFVFAYGDQSGGARVIDSQWLTSTIYGSTVMGGSECFFGFNFADGRIKCYPLQVRQGGNGGYFAMFVRGGNGYGQNKFLDNGDGTVSDYATGLMWMQDDNGSGVVLDDALNYCESLALAGYDDWRLPNIKELQSIVDYDRSPDVTNSPAIDPVFNVSAITNEAGQSDYPFFWSSTTHISYPSNGSSAAYISFGRALGYMAEFGGWIDVHGAGAQRSDQKTALTQDYPQGFGPQGDARRSDNYVRCVRGGVAEPANGDDLSNLPQSNNGDTPPQAQNGDNPPSQNGNTSPNEPDLVAAAQKLGISEQTLREALGAPPPDIQAAAQKLGITPQQLEDALGIQTP